MNVLDEEIEVVLPAPDGREKKDGRPRSPLRFFGDIPEVLEDKEDGSPEMVKELKRGGMAGCGQ